MKSVNDEITEAFFAYLRDRNISDETKFAWFEKQRVETGIDYVDYYNGLIDWAGKFLMEFEDMFELFMRWGLTISASPCKLK